MVDATLSGLVQIGLNTASSAKSVQDALKTGCKYSEKYFGFGDSMTLRNSLCVFSTPSTKNPINQSIHKY